MDLLLLLLELFWFEDPAQEAVVTAPEILENCEKLSLCCDCIGIHGPLLSNTGLVYMANGGLTFWPLSRYGVAPGAPH